MIRRRGWMITVAVLVASLGLAAAAYAGNLTQGLVDIVSGPFELPKQILVGTFSGPPIIGTLAGAVVGAVSAVGTTLRGVAEVATGAVGLGSSLAPYAPYVLPFLF